MQTKDIGHREKMIEREKAFGYVLLRCHSHRRHQY